MTSIHPNDTYRPTKSSDGMKDTQKQTTEGREKHHVHHPEIQSEERAKQRATLHNKYKFH